jgi:uncharacterized membrane protein (DUF2068 family)
MRPAKPASVIVIAILQIGLGTLGFFAGICGGAFEIAEDHGLFAELWGPQSVQEKEAEKEMQRALESGPAYKIINFGKDALDLLICLAMVISGVGLLRMRAWGRWLAIIVAVISLAEGLAFISYTLGFTVPAVYQFSSQKQPANLDERFDLAFLKIQAIGPIIGESIFLIYPVVVLIVMTRPAVAAAFRSKA